MTKGRFALLAAALGLVTMGGAGYLAYAAAAPSSHATGSGAGTSTGADAAASGRQGGGTGTADGGSATPAPACVNGDVRVTGTDGQGAAGTISLVLVFQNVSGHRCSLRGYPGASIAGPGGEDLLDAERVRGEQPEIPEVALDAGGRASALLRWSDVPSGTGPGGCAVQDAVTLLVTPPNFTQSSALSLGPGTDVCSAFEIHPVVKGVIAP